MQCAANLTLAKPEKIDNGWSHRESIEAVTAAGFRHLDMSFAFEATTALRYGATPFYSDAWRGWCEDMRTLALAHGADFTQTHNLMFNYFDPSPANVALLPMVERAIEATALLGAGITVMHPIAPPGEEGNLDVCLKSNRDYFRHLSDVAQRHGVKLAVENMLSSRHLDGTVYWRYCHTLEQLTTLVDAIGRPNVGICLDAGHAHYMGLKLDESIRLAGESLIAVHIHDNNRFDDQHLCPYVGTADWQLILKTLKEVRYEGFFTLEVLHLSERMPAHLRVPFIRQLYELTQWMAAQADDKGDVPV